MTEMNVPTAGEWIESLPRWKRTIFNTLRAIVGATLAIEWCGYHRDMQNLPIILDVPIFQSRMGIEIMFMGSPVPGRYWYIRALVWGKARWVHPPGDWDIVEEMKKPDHPVANYHAVVNREKPSIEAVYHENGNWYRIRYIPPKSA